MCFVSVETRGMNPIVIFDVFLCSMTNKRKWSFDLDELEPKFRDAIRSYEQSNNNIVSLQFWRLCSISNWFDASCGINLLYSNAKRKKISFERSKCMPS